MDFSNADLKILTFFQHHRLAALDPIFSFITDTIFIAYVVPVCLFLYAYLKKKPTLKVKSIKIMAALIFNALLVTLLKYTIQRARPYEISADIEKMSGGGNPSFPSGHTADAFVLAICLVSLFPKNKALIVFALFWAICVAYSRMILGVHYLSDVLASVLLSYFSAFIVLRFSKNRWNTD